MPLVAYFEGPLLQKWRRGCSSCWYRLHDSSHRAQHSPGPPASSHELLGEAFLRGHPKFAAFLSAPRRPRPASGTQPVLAHFGGTIRDAEFTHRHPCISKSCSSPTCRNNLHIERNQVLNDICHATFVEN